MQDRLSAKVDLFIQNIQTKNNYVPLAAGMKKRFAALIYTMADKPMDWAKVGESYRLIKSRTGIFSTFRGNLSLALSANLSLADDAAQRLEDALSVYNQLKAVGFYASDYLVMAAYQIASHAKPDQYADVVARTRTFYLGMKAHHWFLTGQDDYIFAAMLGLSGIDPVVGVDRMETLYNWLKPDYWVGGNSIQGLTQVLVLGGESDDTLQRLQSLSQILRQKRLRMDRQFTLPSLGILALLPNPVEFLADQVAEVYAALHGKKGLGYISTTKQELLLLCAALVASEASETMPQSLLPTLTTSMTNILMAQQAAMIAAMAAASSAAASSSSH